MKDQLPGIKLGFILGFTVAIVIMALPSSDASLYRKAIDECEKTLPRNQHCKVMGIPEEENK